MTRRTTKDFLTIGFSVGRKRKGLAFLLYAVNAVLSLIVAAPVFVLMKGALGDSGYGPDLAKEFNLPVWSDLWNEIFPAGGAVSEIRTIVLLLLICAPVLLLWKTVSSVGIVNAVRDNGLRGFWQGVGQYSGKAVLVALPYFLFSTASVFGVVFAMATIGSVFGTERVMFWVVGIGIPVLWLILLSAIDLMHDYSRIGIVARDETVTTAFGNGVAWLFKHPGAIPIYCGWMLIGLVVLGIPILLDSTFTAGTWFGIGALVAVQQYAMYWRAKITVGWFASEVEFFEAIRFFDEPLIAESGGESAFSEPGNADTISSLDGTGTSAVGGADTGHSDNLA